MESRDYQELAPKTSSGVHDVDKIKDRFCNGSSYELLRYALKDVIGACHTLELVKKLIFYGKPLVALPQGFLREQPRDLPVLPKELFDRLGADVELLHGAVGLATEAGELLSQVSAQVLDGDVPDPINLVEELGDLSWYLALAAKSVGTPFEKIWEANIAKLRARYPDGVFDEKFAHNRDVKAERAAIDGVKSRSLQEHMETLEPGDRVRSGMPINGKYVEGVIVKVESDVITFDPSTLDGYELKDGELATFRNYRKGAWVMVRKAQPYQHPQPGQTCSCPHCVPGKYNLVSDRLDEASVEVEREAIGFGELARQALIEDTAYAVARPGVTWVGQGYALFDINKFPTPDDLPLSFYWVDYHRLPDAVHDLVKAKMKDRERYHVGHFPATPGPAFKLPGTSRVCTCASCMPPLPAPAPKAGA